MRDVLAWIGGLAVVLFAFWVGVSWIGGGVRLPPAGLIRLETKLNEGAARDLGFVPIAEAAAAEPASKAPAAETEDEPDTEDDDGTEPAGDEPKLSAADRLASGIPDDTIKSSGKASGRCEVWAIKGIKRGTPMEVLQAAEVRVKAKVCPADGSKTPKVGDEVEEPIDGKVTTWRVTRV